MFARFRHNFVIFIFNYGVKNHIYDLLIQKLHNNYKYLYRHFPDAKNSPETAKKRQSKGYKPLRLPLSLTIRFIA